MKNIWLQQNLYIFASKIHQNQCSILLDSHIYDTLRYQSLLHIKLSKDIYYRLQMHGKEMKIVERYNANKKNHSGDDDI